MKRLLNRFEKIRTCNILLSRKGFQAKAPFASSLLVEIRKRMGQMVFDEFHEAIIETIKPRRTKKSVKAIDDDNDGNDVSNSGDVSSCCHYSADLRLLNEAREFSGPTK